MLKDRWNIPIDDLIQLKKYMNLYIEERRSVKEKTYRTKGKNEHVWKIPLTYLSYDTSSVRAIATYINKTKIRDTDEYNFLLRFCSN